jgi:hypothetical protein
MRRAIRDAIRRRTIRHAMTLSSPTMVRVPGGAGARWCGCPVVRVPGGLMMFSYARLCPVMSGYVRLCPVMSGYVRLCPLMCGDARSLRLPGRFGTVCRGESGPTIRLSRAAEQATIKRHGQTKEKMFVHRQWRRRLQAAVGPGHGRRRAFRSPHRERGRDMTSPTWAGT